MNVYFQQNAAVLHTASASRCTSDLQISKGVPVQIRQVWTGVVECFCLPKCVRNVDIVKDVPKENSGDGVHNGAFGMQPFRETKALVVLPHQFLH